MPELYLIDKAKLLSDIWDDLAFLEGAPVSARDAAKYLDNLVRKQPTIEAEPVRHGRWIGWIDVPDANTKVAKCSLCEFWQRTNGDDKTGKHLIHTAVYRYCAGCGARMDERGDDNGNG